MAPTASGVFVASTVSATKMIERMNTMATNPATTPSSANAGNSQNEPIS